MRRFHFFEISDQNWCPSFIRDGATDIMQFMVNVGKEYDRIVPKLKTCMQKAGTDRILDMCSGAGGPWHRVTKVLREKEGYPVKVLLTDIHPSENALKLFNKSQNIEIQYYENSIDATKIPNELEGFRTMFGSFHHFRPQQAKEILKNIVTTGHGVGIFEFTQRSLITILLMLTTPLLVFFITPILRPFRISRYIFTYLIPIIPLVATLDGFVSAYRTYSAEELKELVNQLPANDYIWDIGYVSALPASPIPVTYLFGYRPQLQEINPKSNSINRNLSSIKME